MKTTLWKKKRGKLLFSFLAGLCSLRAQQKSVLHTEYAIDGFSIANSVVITQQDKKLIGCLCV